VIHPLRRAITFAFVAGLGLAGVGAATTAAAAAPVHQSAPSTRKVVVRDCPGDKYKVAPRQFLIACGDGGTYVQDIHWSNWGARRAHGKGSLWQNDCEPNCATGKYHHEPATITLTRLADRHGRLDYGYVTVIPSKPNHYHFGPSRLSLV
jgi:hypothetical protein